MTTPTIRWIRTTVRRLSERAPGNEPVDETVDVLHKR